ncbi:MAG: LegC family aminotransferase [Methylococcaceae bacterium]|jgi:aminotransferase in exopolysaccharide biosynthesis
MFDDFIHLVKDIYPNQDFIPLHAPRFNGNEKQYLMEVIDSSFVSSVGPFVNQFEAKVAEYTGAKHAIAVVSGTAALHIALLLSGVKPGEEVITQAITFVATCNAIHYCGAEPVFVDIEPATLGMSATALAEFIDQYCEQRDDGLWNKYSGKRIAACVPMHTFGHPCDMAGILLECKRCQIPVVEDAAEALGSFSGGQACGTFGQLGVFSFNGNKIITTGGGGMIITDDDDLARQALHLTTTAKLPHAWQFIHDQVGYNYRMPNLNAALGVAQLEALPQFLEKKRQLAQRYIDWGQNNNYCCFIEPAHAQSNYWLNALVFEDVATRNCFAETTNTLGVMTRPVWEPMHRLPSYQHCLTAGLSQTHWAADCIVNIPSSVIL